MQAFPKKALLTSALFDSLLNGWITTWWLLVFTRLLSQEVISTRTIVSSIVTIITGIYIVKRMNIPPIWCVILLDILCYLNLGLLWINVEAFYVIGGIGVALISAVMESFNSALLSQNLGDENDERVKFDNKYNLIRAIGGVIGGIIAYKYLFSCIDIKWVWCVLYVLFDLDFMLRLVLIKTGHLSYRVKVKVVEK